jgi:thermitase
VAIRRIRGRRLGARGPPDDAPGVNARTARTSALAAGLLIGWCAPAAAQAAAPDVGERIVLRHRAGLSAAERIDLRAGAGVRFGRAVGLPGVEVVTASGSRAAALAGLRSDPDVVWAEPDRLATIDATDPLFDQQTGLRNPGGPGAVADADIDADEAWAVSRGAGATVAVIDTGVDESHVDLAGQLEPGVNVIADGRPSPEDGNGHGTHVAGTIAAAENGIGVVGVAPAAHVLALRVLGDLGWGSAADVATAFDLAGDRGIRIVNASLSSTAPSAAQEEAIASHPGTLYVVAAGNAGTDAGSTYPCALPLPNVLCVGATDTADLPAGFSNAGATSVDLHAPGVGVPSTWPDDDYAALSGTSMATPHVAGAAALVASAHPGWSAAAIKAALLDSVDARPSLLGRSVTGGRLNAARALGVPVDLDGRTPARPTGLSAAPAAGGASLRWDASPEPDVAAYRVWRQADDGGWVEQLTTAGPAAEVAGLPADRPQSFRVSALDASGHESEPSAAVAVVPGALPAPAPEPSPAPVAAPPASPPAARLAGVRVSGLTVSARPRTVRFRLSAAASVRVTVSVLARGRWRRAAVRTLRFGAGAHAVRPSGAPASGTWRVTVTAGEGGATRTFRLR